MKKVLFILLFVFACSLSSVAQMTLPDKVSARIPDCLMTGFIKESDLSKISKENNYGQSNSTGIKKYWDVYSDRSSNPVYNKPNRSSEIVNELKFNQRVRIAEIDKNNGFALVYEEVNTNVNYPDVSADAKKSGALGWVPMENLLLWNTCPADKHGILCKALLAQNMNKTANGISYQRYENPETKENATGLGNDVNFYFVMKRASNGLVLLSREAKIEGDTYNVLLGWVSESSYTPWNQRSCLEFNWRTIEIEDKLKGDSVAFYRTEDFSQKISQDYYKYGINDGLRVGKEKRFSGNILRLPILENLEDKYHITYFAAPNGEMSYHEANRVQNESKAVFDKFVENVKSMNLILVVDGTQSMEPYFESLYGTIKAACENYANKDYQVKLGLVIYRDYRDVLNGDSCYVEYVPMSPMDDGKLFNFFKTGGKYGIKSAKGDDYSEALYEGLYAALDTTKMRYSSKESNLIIVVGDCGNRYEDKRSPSYDSIMKRMSENKVNMISFQVHNMEKPNVDAWIEYNQQMYDLILDNVEKQYKASTEKGGEFKPYDDRGYDFKVDEGRSLYIASMRNPKLNQSMPVEELGRLINDNVLAFTQSVGEQIDAAYNVYSNVNTIIATGGNAPDTTFFKNQVGEKHYELIKKKNMLIAIDGYAPKTNSRGGEYFKSVLFIERKEFENLLSQFRKVYDAAKEDTNRDPYINAMKQLLHSMVPDKSIEEMDKLGSAYLREVISGLNEKTAGIGDRTFEELQDVNVVKDAEFKSIVRDFKAKFRALDNIYGGKYEYIFKSNNQTYYWIPFDQLP